MTKDQYIRKLRKQLKAQLDISNRAEAMLDSQFSKFGVPDEYEEFEEELLTVGSESGNLLVTNLKSLK